MSQEELKNNVLCENLHNHNVLRSWEGGARGCMAPLALSPIANDIRSSYNGLTGKYALYLNRQSMTVI